MGEFAGTPRLTSSARCTRALAQNRWTWRGCAEHALRLNRGQTVGQLRDSQLPPRFESPLLADTVLAHTAAAKCRASEPRGRVSSRQRTAWKADNRTRQTLLECTTACRNEPGVD